MQNTVLVPNYYKDFHCIADKCRHTCCVGWDIEVNEEALGRFERDEFYKKHIEKTPVPHIKLTDSGRCPFLLKDGLCEMIKRDGEDMLCGICRDHPRFRNFWSGVTEMGLGLVCEEAARLILSYPQRLALLKYEGDAKFTLCDEEKYLWDLRDRLILGITETGPRARLLEYLIFRHLPDALYDGLVGERLKFIADAFLEITAMWEKTDGSLDAIAECARAWSYDVEYNDGEITARLESYKTE